MNMELLFTKVMIRCPCGCNFVIVNPELIYRLTSARYQTKQNFHIVSWCRCQDYNIKVYGSELSSHMDGEAVDILTVNHTDRYEILAALIHVGFKRIIIYGKYIHTDISKTKTSPYLMIGGQEPCQK